MKKITLSLLIALGAMTAEAQIVSSTSSIVTKEVQNVKYVKVGFDIGSSSSSDINVKSGVSFLFGTEFNIKESGFYYGGEAGFAPNGMEHKTNISTSYSEYTETNLVEKFDTDGSSYHTHETTTTKLCTKTERSEYIKGYRFLFNPKIGYKHHITDDITLDANVGMFGSFGFGKSKYGYESVTYSYTNDSEIYDQEDIFDSSSHSGKDKGVSYFGVSLGVGAWYKDKYSASLEYQKGLPSTDFTTDNINYFRIALAMRVNKPKTVVKKM